MKLINSTAWPDWFVRRMVSWCCKELEIGSREVRRFKLRNRTDGFSSGHCYPRSGEICVSLGIVNLNTETVTSGELYYRKTVDELVRVTAHEVAHRMLGIGGNRSRKSRRYHNHISSGGSEAQTVHFERKVMEAFIGNKAALLAEWEAPPQRTAKPVQGITERRSEKANRDLERWQRKLKVATNKVRKLRIRVRYYERKATG